MVGLQILRRSRQVSQRLIAAFADIPVANVSDCMVLAATRDKVAAEEKMLAAIAADQYDSSWVDARLKAIGCDPNPR